MYKIFFVLLLWAALPINAHAQTMSDNHLSDKVQQLISQFKDCQLITLAHGQAQGHDGQWLLYHHIDCWPEGRLATFTSYNVDQNRQRDILFDTLKTWLDKHSDFKKMPGSTTASHSRFEVSYTQLP